MAKLKDWVMRYVFAGRASTAADADTNEVVVTDAGAMKVELSGSNVTEFTLQNAATQTQNGDAMSVSGLATAILNLTGAFVATITFEVTSDDANWEAIPVARVTDGVPTTTATAAGQYIVNVAGFKSLRARISAYTSGAVTATGRGIAIDRSMRGVLLPEVTGTPGQAAPGKAVQIGGYNGSVVKVPYVSANIGAHGSGWAMGVEGFVNASLMYANNGSSRDTWMNNTEGTLLASAARTATTFSPDQTNYNARGVLVSLYITANPGNSETVQIEIQRKDPVSGQYAAISRRSVVTAANGAYSVEIYPGASAATISGHENYALGLPRTWRAAIVHSASGSWTYSVGYQYIV